MSNRATVDEVLVGNNAVVVRHDGRGEGVPLRDPCGRSHPVAILDEECRTVRDAVSLALAPLLIHHVDLAVSGKRDGLSITIDDRVEKL